MVKYGVITRIQYVVESPYLISFCKWYLDYLHFDRIYFICFDKKDVNLVRKKIKEYHNKTRIIVGKKHENVNNSFDQFIPKIKINYLLHVDMDEYLYVNGNSIQTFMNEYKNHNYFKFGWLQIPSIHWRENTLNEALFSNDIHMGFDGKAMCLVNTVPKEGKSRRNVLISLKPHEMNLTIQKNKKNFFNNKSHIMENGKLYCILHFCSRGISDLLLKMYFQKLPNTKSANRPKQLRPLFLKNIKDMSQIPTRLIVLMRLSATKNLNKADEDNIKVILKKNMPEIEIDSSELDNNLRKLENSFTKIPKDIVEYYEILKKTYYKESFNKIGGNHHNFIKTLLKHF
jgi:hypothetical protein